MRRWLFNSVTALSLLLCMATVALWTRSYWKFDHLTLGTGTDRPCARCDYAASSARGRVACWRSVIQFSIGNFSGVPLGWYRGSRSIFVDDDVAKEARSRGTALLGFGYLHDGTTHSPGNFNEDVAVVLPHAAIVFAFAVLPAAWLQHRRALRRRNPKLCYVCGYDLRGTPDRCPECGAVAKSNDAIRREATAPVVFSDKKIARHRDAETCNGAGFRRGREASFPILARTYF